MFPLCPEVKKEKMKAGELWSGSVRFGSGRFGSTRCGASGAILQPSCSLEFMSLLNQ